jgi:hypothetical protein
MLPMFGIPDKRSSTVFGIFFVTAYWRSWTTKPLKQAKKESFTEQRFDENAPLLSYINSFCCSFNYCDR